MLRQAASAAEALRVIEQHHKIFGPGTGGVALHALAVLAAPLPKEERNKLCAEPTVGGADGLLMQLGKQLSGAGEADAAGLTGILWALALLDQGDSPLLGGLVKRLLLLLNHGKVPPNQLLVAAQALARLQLLGGAVGAAVVAHVRAHLADFHCAQLGTLARALVGALGGAGAEPLLRDLLANPAIFMGVQGGTPPPQPQQLHACASLFVALAAAELAPPPPPEALNQLLGVVVGELDLRAVVESRGPDGLARLAELAHAMQTLGASAHPLAATLAPAISHAVATLPDALLPETIEAMEKEGASMAPALVPLRERHATTQTLLRAEIAQCTDERVLVALMRERPLEPACFCLALERLNTQVQACPDPEAWAAQITRSPDFQPVLGRLHRLLPQFDAAQLSQVTRAATATAITPRAATATTPPHKLTHPAPPADARRARLPPLRRAPPPHDALRPDRREPPRLQLFRRRAIALGLLHVRAGARAVVPADDAGCGEAAAHAARHAALPARARHRAARPRRRVLPPPAPPRHRVIALVAAAVVRRAAADGARALPAGADDRGVALRAAHRRDRRVLVGGRGRARRHADASADLPGAVGVRAPPAAHRAAGADVAVGEYAAGGRRAAAPAAGGPLHPTFLR